MSNTSDKEEYNVIVILLDGSRIDVNEITLTEVLSVKKVHSSNRR